LAWVDRENFDKVLMNLLSNAFKFCTPGGHIAIQLTHDDSQVHIAISNDGPPIAEDKLERIFERFYQMPESRGTLGTGIGLDLTRALVELHYGSIVARNLPGAKGCVFEVSLPLGHNHLKPEEIAQESENTSAHHSAHTLAELEAEDQAPGEDQQNINSQLSNHGRQHIVIVEDDDEISQYLSRELESDYTVSTYPNGKVALQHILSNPPSLIISDIMMPEMDGNTLCATLKTNINTNHIPVILLTAKNTDEDQLEGLETGADAYLTKPINMDILRRTIVNMLHQRETLRNKFNGSETQEGVVETVKVNTPNEKLMERIMAVVNRNLSDSDLSVDQIANEVGISRVHLYRKLKELTNQAPQAFIRNLRLRQAAQLLATSNQNISEVMYACGFTNATSFSVSIPYSPYFPSIG
jgi:DNA-binding response OmpR family regulator